MYQWKRRKKKNDGFSSYGRKITELPFRFDALKDTSPEYSFLSDRCVQKRDVPVCTK